MHNRFGGEPMFLCSREPQRQTPCRVEYKLTETGEPLVPIIRQLTDWAMQIIQSIMRHLKKYEAGAKK